MTVDTEVILEKLETVRKETLAHLDGLTQAQLGWRPSAARQDVAHAGGLHAMNGTEWLAAYAGHEAFHHQQIDVLVERWQETQTG